MEQHFLIYFAIKFVVRPGSVLSHFLFAIYLDRHPYNSLSYSQIFHSTVRWWHKLTFNSSLYQWIELQRLFSNCEREVLWLDTHINVKKSHYMRIGPRFNVSCTRVTTSDGHSISLPWVDEIRYLGRYTVSQKTRHQTLAHYFPKY